MNIRRTNLDKLVMMKRESWRANHDFCDQHLCMHNYYYYYKLLVVEVFSFKFTTVLEFDEEKESS